MRKNVPAVLIRGAFAEKQTDDIAQIVLKTGFICYNLHSWHAYHCSLAIVVGPP